MGDLSWIGGSTCLLNVIVCPCGLQYRLLESCFYMIEDSSFLWIVLSCSLIFESYSTMQWGWTHVCNQRSKNHIRWSKLERIYEATQPGFAWTFSPHVDCDNLLIVYFSFNLASEHAILMREVLAYPSFASTGNKLAKSTVTSKHC